MRQNDFSSGLFSKQVNPVCPHCGESVDPSPLYNDDVGMYLNINYMMCKRCLVQYAKNNVSEIEVIKRMKYLGFNGRYSKPVSQFDIDIDGIINKMLDDDFNKKRSFVFYGKPGTGKTFASAYVFYKLMLMGEPFDQFGRIKLIDTIKAVGEIFNPSASRDVFEKKYGSIFYLIIELLDIPESQRRLTDYQSNLLHDIIDRRYQANLPTIFITTAGSDQLKRIISTATVDRIIAMSEIIKFTKNWRT